MVELRPRELVQLAGITLLANPPVDVTNGIISIIEEESAALKPRARENLSESLKVLQISDEYRKTTRDLSALYVAQHKRRKITEADMRRKLKAM